MSSSSSSSPSSSSSSVPLDSASPDPESSLEAQTKASLDRDANNIWSAVRAADLPRLQSLIDSNTGLVYTRGPVGELPLHLLFLYNTPAHQRAALFLLDRFPSLILEQYGAGPYFGENCLHIAIIQQDGSLVAELIRREPRLLTQRATGKFFQRGSACPYGDYPLHFAACTNQLSLVELLLPHCDLPLLEASDSDGNNLLHHMVLHQRPALYKRIKEEFIKRRGVTDSTGFCLWNQRNHDGFTPFTLAANEGLADMFAFLLEEQKQVQWAYGPVTCVLYPLEELDLQFQASVDSPPASDSDSVSSRSRPLSALELIVQHGHLPLLMHPHLVDLLGQKWNRFAERIFVQRFIATLAFLVVFTINIIMRSGTQADSSGEAPAAAEQLIDGLNHTSFPASPHSIAVSSSLLSSLSLDSVFLSVSFSSFFSFLLRILCSRSMGDCLVLFGTVAKLAIEVRQMRRRGLWIYLSSSGSAFLENFFSLLFVALSLSALALQALQSPLALPVLSLCAVTGWVYLLFFLLAFRLTGPMVIMIYSMLKQDVARFLIIFAVFLVAFSQAFYILMFNTQSLSLTQSVIQSALILVGEFDMSIYLDAQHPIPTVAIFLLYVVLINILLLNLLIALFGFTYNSIDEESDKIWHLERARIILEIEFEMSDKERKMTRNKYWTEVNGRRFMQIKQIDQSHFKKAKTVKTQ